MSVPNVNMMLVKCEDLMARLAGFEPATRCLEDAAQLSDVVSYLGK
jgi:hypothetical protein